MPRAIPTIDLFAGAGGLSLGAMEAGADVRVHLDNDAPSCDTLRSNPHHANSKVIDADVREIDGEELRGAAGVRAGEPLLVVGGAPCQPFSKAAYWLDPGEEAKYRRARAQGKQAAKPDPLVTARPDERRTLVEEWWRIVVESRADGFVFENVPSILHPRNRPVLEGLRAAAEGAGFGTRLVEANAVDYGVAQRRHRVFLLGAKGVVPEAPQPTHPEPVTARQALAPFRAKRFFEPEEVVTGRWAQHLRDIPPGMNYKFHTAWAGHPSPSFVAETRFWNFLLKLDPAQPSWTVPANPGPWVGPFHWDGRRLRTPEAAALQGFPEGYVFTGGRRERIRQIGNAVPPPLAAAVVGEVLRAVHSARA